MHIQKTSVEKINSVEISTALSLIGRVVDAVARNIDSLHFGNRNEVHLSIENTRENTFSVFLGSSQSEFQNLHQCARRILPKLDRKIFLNIVFLSLSLFLHSDFRSALVARVPCYVFSTMSSTLPTVALSLLFLFFVIYCCLNCCFKITKRTRTQEN